jgi:hydrocephalus-inducing protein
VFKWRNKQFGSDFALLPLSGVVAPHSDLAMTVTFAPSRRGADIRVDRVPCDVEGLPAPLLLTLSGDCVARPPPVGTPLTFACRVRESTTQVITLPKNESDRPINVAPVVTHPYWSGPSVVEVPARSTATCTLTYKPLTMTKEDTAAASASATPAASPSAASDKAAEKAAAAAAAAHAAAQAAAATQAAATQDVDSRLCAQAAAQIGLPAHSGNVFFPLPDGSGLVYALVGKASQPALGGSLHFKTAAKKTLNFVVPVSNWLPVTQRFDVTWDAKSLPASAVLKVRGCTRDTAPGCF